MGTRSLTIFKESDGEEIVVMHRQFDGYLDGHGKELISYLKKFDGIVNGLGGNQGKVANGMGCLAAQVIAHFKEDAGGFYLHPAGTRDAGEEYRYTVYYTGTPAYNKPAEIHLKIEDGYTNWKTLYDGPVSQFNMRKAKKAEGQE